MANVGTNPKQQTHELVDHLSGGQASAVVGLLEAALDSVSVALANAPWTMTLAFGAPALLSCDRA